VLTNQWVRLVVERINSCFTHSAIQLALEECPPGMEAIYDRMAISITQHHSLSDKSLASSVLYRVTCSFRILTVPELLQSLGEDLAESLEMQQIIRNVCSGFVVIDNGGNVAIIHQTAREYLMGGPERLFHVEKDSAHEQLFLSCLKCLMSNGLRAKIKQNTPEFLDYSATWWSSHLVSTPPTCEVVTKQLVKFLSGHWILTWIQILATEGRLRILVQASKHLSEYATRRKKYATAWNERQQVVEQELIESWAVDLVKLVGKFGAILRRNPLSIYKLIPPFCPHNSAIYQQFGKTEARSLMVSGFSTQFWDDSLARLSFRSGIYASSVSAAGSQIAVFASSGIVSLYDPFVFEESNASPVNHGERIYRMKLNNTGTLLVTYGFKTTKVWETGTGKTIVVVANVKSRPRPLEMLITDDNNTLLVGTDDKQLRSLDLRTTSPVWQDVAHFEEEELDGHFLNAASYMALNNDGSLIAVAYRGHPLSAWEVDGPSHISHCWRARETLARGEVIDAVWHPHNPEVFGVYIEGVVFKWNPYFGEPEELNTGASRLAMSGDGNLFATGDVRGTIKVYTAQNLRLLYQLASQDTVLGLAFSVDQRRLYDVRGYYGNTWEPTALMRYGENSMCGTDRESEAESISDWSTTSLVTSQRVDSITVLAASPTGRLYCFGTEYGRVQLYSTQRGKLPDFHTTKSFMSIEQMAWSDNGRYLCYADSGKKVYVVAINTSAANTETVAKLCCEMPLKSLTKGPIQQLLFRPDSNQLLVSTASTICTISLQSSSVIHSRASHLHECKWIIHPQNSELILGFGPQVVKVLGWDLDTEVTYHIEEPLNADSHGGEQDTTTSNDAGHVDLSSPPYGENTQSRRESTKVSKIVDRVLLTSDKRHVLVQLSLARRSKGKEFLFLATSSFSADTRDIAESEQAESEATVTPISLPQEMTSQIALALSFLKRDRLVFLSRSFEICSWHIPPNLDSVSLPNPSRSAVHKSVASTHTIGARHPSQQSIRGSSMPADNAVSEIFALPGDWISRDCLELCMVWLAEKSLLCPRNGEVAVVRCASFV
jgi:WD40 repeat protein